MSSSKMMAGIGSLWLLLALTGFAGPAAEEPRDAPARPGSIPLSLDASAGSPPGAAQDAGAGEGGLPFDWQAWAVVVAAVAGIVGLRFVGRQQSSSLPADVFEVLGVATLGSSQPVRIVRFGPKTLLVTTGTGGPRTLAELDDPLATEWIAAACRGDRTLRPVTETTGQQAGRSPRATPVQPRAEAAAGRLENGAVSYPPAEVA